MFQFPTFPNPFGQKKDPYSDIVKKDPGYVWIGKPGKAYFFWEDPNFSKFPRGRNDTHEDLVASLAVVCSYGGDAARICYRYANAVNNNVHAGLTCRWGTATDDDKRTADAAIAAIGKGGSITTQAGGSSPVGAIGAGIKEGASVAQLISDAINKDVTCRAHVLDFGETIDTLYAEQLEKERMIMPGSQQSPPALETPVLPVPLQPVISQPSQIPVSSPWRLSMLGRKIDNAGLKKKRKQ